MDIQQYYSILHTYGATRTWHLLLIYREAICFYLHFIFFMGISYQYIIVHMTTYNKGNRKTYSSSRRVFDACSFHNSIPCCYSIHQLRNPWKLTGHSWCTTMKKTTISKQNKSPYNLLGKNGRKIIWEHQNLYQVDHIYLSINFHQSYWQKFNIVACTLYKTPLFALKGGGLHFSLRSLISSPVKWTSIPLFRTSIVIISPFLMKAIGPPSCKNQNILLITVLYRAEIASEDWKDRYLCFWTHMTNNKPVWSSWESSIC